MMLRSPLRSALPALALALSFAAAHASPHFATCHERTGNNATVIVPASAVDLGGAPMAAEDEVAVFTPNGVCAGWASWDGANAALAVWADNPMTPTVDGFVPDEPMRFVIWDASEGMEYGQDVPVAVEYHADFEDEGVFQPDAVYLVSSLSASPPVANEPGAPAAFALTGNYPNPFTERTTITFELPRDARVTLEVYDLLGHRVGVLVDEVRRAGRHEAYFHAGADVASGVYVYRLRAGEHTSHRKMILLN
jgi:hypothetical protein